MFDYKIVTKEKLLLNRTKGIGSADIPVLAGYAVRYGQTPHKLWLQKTGQEPQAESNESLYWGTALEHVIAKRFIDDNLISYYLTNTEFVHPDHSFAIAHPDLIYRQSGQTMIAEIKTATIQGGVRRTDQDYGYSQDDRSSQGVPASVYCQVQWQLFCTDLQQASVCVLINTSDYRVYAPIERSEKVINRLLSLADRFWWHVKNNVEPTPQTWQDVKRVYTEVKENQCIIYGETSATAWALKEKNARIESAIKRLKQKKDECKNAIALLIGENKELLDEEGKKIALQYCINRDIINLTELAKNPWLYSRVKKYITQASSRVLRF